MVDSLELPEDSNTALLAAGMALMLVGLMGISFGSLWSAQALELFAANEIISKFELIIPFLPILLIAAGTWFIARSRT